MQPKVWIVQEPLSGDRDFRPAQEFGTLRVLLEPGPVALSTAPMMRELRSKLREFRPEDFLLASGDPVAIAAASIVASQMLGKTATLQILRWDKQSRQYMVLELAL